MFHNTTQLKANYDLRDVIAQDLGPPPVRSGRAALYKCPFHNERKGYSFAVWSDGYRCFGKCDTSGDVFDWLVTYRRLTFAEALHLLDAPSVSRQCNVRPASPEPTIARPPDDEWQQAARAVVSTAEDHLWSAEGEPALAYLLKRGLTTTTIREARLGFVPGDFREWREIAGLNVPCGITIPWLADGHLWAVKVRRAAGGPKYVQVAGGSTDGLYNADALVGHHAALFCEGEFDALILQQEAGDLLASVTLGSATARLSGYWHDKLVGQRTIFVSYDQDTAGERGMNRLLKLSPRFQPLLLPDGKDVTDFYLSGGDVYAWVAGALSRDDVEVVK